MKKGTQTEPAGGASTHQFAAGVALPSWLEAIAPYGIFTTDRNLRITTWNEWLSNHSGFPAAEVIGRLLIEVYPDLKVRRVVERYGQALAGEISVVSTALHQYLLPFPTTAGTSGLPHMLQSARIAPLFDHGTVNGTITIIEDVSQREFQAAVLRRQQELDRILSSALALLLQSKTPADELPKIFAMMNPTLGLDAYLGYLLSADEKTLVLKASGGIAPKAPEALTTLTLSDADRLVLRDSTNPGELTIAEHGVALRRMGVRACYSFPLGIGGRLIGMVVFASYGRDVIVPSDVTVLDRIASYIAVAIDRTLRERAVIDASRAKDDFLAALSHELRTPLNPVLLVASDSAENPAYPAEARDAFRMIENNVRLEARLIDDLLDLTRIEHGKLGLEFEVLDVHTALNDALLNVRGEIIAHELTVHTEMRAAHHTVRADAGRLQQVFWNVIKNAVKFTPRGGQVWVTTAVGPLGNELVVQVRDTGIGMEPAELQKIFGAFMQGDHAPRGHSHRFGGLGLGLAISEKLVSLHGGRIEAASEGKDRGSTFSIYLPLVASTGVLSPRPAASASGSAHPLPSGEGKKILLVEDHEATRSSLAHLLRRRGYVVVAVASKSAALHEAAQQQFGLVLSDIGLPDGDGFDLMRQLQKLHGLTGIALTGYGMEEDLARSSNAGFSAHLTKPINVQLLDRTLEDVFSR